MDLTRVAEREPAAVTGGESEAERSEASNDRSGESEARSASGSERGGTTRERRVDREAAVLAPVVTRDGADHVLFTKRADHLSDHPGQMSFPGGGREPEDDDLLATALREANEEIGLRDDEVEIAGQLDDIQTITNYQVRPFVGTIADREYAPGDEEVAEIAVLPVAGLTEPDNYESERRDHPHYGEIRLHFFRVGGFTVWGATANMLVQLLELTTEWELPAEPDRVVDADADLPG